ncbi:MAG: C-terminal binding protein [Candidatus Latescibacterota bacterium]
MSPSRAWKVVVTDATFSPLDLEEEVLRQLGCRIEAAQCRTVEEVAALVAGADAVLTQFAPVKAPAIAAMGSCRVIVRYGIGVDNVDLQAAAARGIPVCNVPDYCIDEVADHTLALLLSLTRRVVANHLWVRGGEWGLAGRLEQMLALKYLTVGLVAFGRIAREVAARLQPFKCRVLVHDPHVEAAVILQAGCTPASLEEVLTGSEVVSLHCPSTERTRGMINAQTLASMKPGALLVNASRGDLVVTEDLVAALQSGHLGGAALDVTSPEPPPADHPLRSMDNVVLSSHVASATVQAVRHLRTRAAHAVAAALRGEALPNVVNGVTPR